MSVPTTSHPPAEIMAAVAEGKLKRRELEPLLAHLEECSACRTELELVSQTAAEEEASPQKRSGARVWWLGAGIAATLAAAISLTVIRPWQSRESGIEALAELAPRSARIVEPRLSGGFAYAPYSGPLRAGSQVAEAERLKLGGQAGIAIEQASRDRNAEAQHTAGVAYLLVENPDQAIAHLRTGAEASPQDPAIWSDLAAAQYAAAVRIPAPSLLPQALASADSALERNPNHPEALFNRALIFERMGLTQQARSAWERYLAVDPSSRWAVEARSRLRALPATNSDALFRKELPHLEQTAAVTEGQGTNAPVASIVRRWREQSRAWGEAEFLGRWGEAELRGDSAEAARLLAIARSLGAQLREQSGEGLLAGAVAAIDGASENVRKTLAAAHTIYRRGRITYSRQQPSAAERDLRQAATLFAQGRSPMERMARYYAANTRFDQNDLAGAAREFEVLLIGAPSAHHACAALIRFQLARCHAASGDITGALELLSAAAAALRRLDERGNVGLAEAMLADLHTAAGRPDDAWAARIRSFAALSIDGRGNQLAANLAGTIAMERRAGRRDAAMSLLAAEREALRELGDDAMLAVSLSRAAVLSAEAGDVADAARLVEELRAAAARVHDAGLRSMIEAHAGLAEGAATLRSDPRRAAQQLAAAARAHEAMGHYAPAIDCHLLQARAERALGDDTAAGRTIDTGLERFERFRVPLAGGAADEGVLESGRELFAEAIRLSLDRDEPALAFGYADHARTRFDVAPAPAASSRASEVQARLARSGTALLEIVVLPEETIVFALDSRTVIARRQRIARSRLETLARKTAEGDRTSAASLYDLLIRPAGTIRRAGMLTIVADPPLDAVPFAALYDTASERYLVEQLPLALAESASSLRVAPSLPRLSHAVAMALPSGASTGSATLAETSAEVAEVAGTYVHGTVLTAERATFADLVAAGRDAEVLHLSGHTEQIGSGGTAALRFASERVPWKTIASSSFPHLQVAILGACNTLRLPPRHSGARAPSLGGAFLAAGARAAIGTLRPVGDRDARLLFRAIHQQLSAGASPAEAVRRAQLDAIAAGAPPHTWSSVAVVIRELHPLT